MGPLKLGTKHIYLEIKEIKYILNKVKVAKKCYLVCNRRLSRSLSASQTSKDALRNMLKLFLLFGCIKTQCPSNSANFGTDTIIGSASGIISAEIDGEYPNNLECSWNIGVPGRNITIVLEYINIEYANNCIYDS